MELANPTVTVAQDLINLKVQTFPKLKSSRIGRLVNLQENEEKVCHFLCFTLPDSTFGIKFESIFFHCFPFKQLHLVSNVLLRSSILNTCLKFSPEEIKRNG